MIYAIIAIVILGLVGYIVRWWNGPKVAEQDRLADEAKYRAQDERRADQQARRESIWEHRARMIRERQARRKKP